MAEAKNVCAECGGEPDVTCTIDKLLDMVSNCECYVDVHDVVRELLEHNIDAHKATDSQITDAITKHQRCYKNLCMECGVDMGECNPRQLCRKTYCDA